VQHRVWIVRNVYTGAPGSLRAKYNAAVREIGALRKLLGKPVAAENPKPRKKTRGVRLKFASNMTRNKFIAGVRKVKEYVRAGDAFQVVLSQRFSAKMQTDPFQVYRALRVVNPSPYMYYLKLGDMAVAGSSPEMLVKVQGRDAFYRPIAGTQPRGRDEKEDQKLEAQMLADPKERAEHIMLVDLHRNDVGRVAVTGSVKVSDVMTVERYSHVMHITSNVTGDLAPGFTALDALRVSLPVGTVSGAPKIRAMQIIDELEPTRRGPYGGAVGYLDFAGNMDTCIALRTIVWKNSTFDVQVGAGVVADSIPENEYEETMSKARAMLKAVEIAQQGF
jgi:anthranilate synthase component 1